MRPTRHAGYGAALLWDKDKFYRDDGEDAEFPSSFYIGEVVLLKMGSECLPMMVREVLFTPGKVRYSLICLATYQTVSMIDSILVVGLRALERSPDLITDTARSYLNSTNVLALRNYLQEGDRWY